MSYYIHDIPGRLRVKTPFIKGSPDASEALLRILSNIEGIDSTSVNTLTGSVIINYNNATVDSGRILSSLTDGGYLEPSKAVSGSQYLENAISKAGGVISRAIIGILIEKALTDSAFCLLAALI